MIGKPKSIRSWLVYGLALVSFTAFTCIGWFAYLISAHEAEEVFDARLATSARVLAALASHSQFQAHLGTPLVVELPAELDGRDEDTGFAGGHPYESKLAFQVWSESGLLLARSKQSPHAQLGPNTPGFHNPEIEGQRWHTFVLVSDGLRIHAAERADIRDEISSEISTAVMVPLALGGLILVVLVNLIARHAVQPLSDLAIRIAARKAQDLEPFDVPIAPRELRPVTQELNLLLRRVRESMGREQRFLDAAAHELRTPLTAVQLHLENALTSTAPSERQVSLENARAACRRTVQLAEQLLAYSRVTATGFESRAPLDLAVTLDSVIEMMEPIFQQRGQSIQRVIQGPLMIEAVRFKIEQLIQNLLANASAHGNQNSSIAVEAFSKKNFAALIIDNEGPCLPEEELTKVFIPHYRASGTRAEGNGLGLAIVQEIVGQHGGTVYLENKTNPMGIRVVVRLPLLTPG